VIIPFDNNSFFFTFTPAFNDYLFFFIFTPAFKWQKAEMTELRYV